VVSQSQALAAGPRRASATDEGEGLTIGRRARERASFDTFASRARAAKLALLVGAEGQGLTAAVEAAADDRVRIPIAPGIDSLNLAVATGIALEHLTRGKV